MKVALIACGPSQAGKSTFTNLLIGENVAAVGRGDGTSVTSKANTYETRIGLVQEIPGYNDSRLQVNNDETAMQSATQLASHGVQAVRFAVFESLSGDTIQLRTTIAELIRQHGEKVKGSIIVIATKQDRADEDELPLRLSNIESTMRDLGIGINLVVWASKVRGAAVVGSALDEQLERLNAAIKATVPVATDELQQLTHRIQERAQHLCDNQIPERLTKTEVVQEYYLEPTKYQEPYEMTYYHPVTKSKLAKDIEDYGGLAVSAMGAITLGIHPLVQGLREHTDWVNETKTKYREVTRQEPRTRWVPREVSMEHRKRVEYFVHQAREEILAEIRDELRA